MRKEILKQVPNIKKEICDLEKEIKSVQKQIDELRQERVYDTVVGSREDLSIGPIRVRGHPKGYEKRIDELQKKKTLMDNKRLDLIRVENEAEEYIQSIQDSGMRRIMRYRYISGFTWQQVAREMGPGYSSDGCRVAHNRFMSG